MCRVVCAFGGGVSSCPLVQRSAGFRCFRTCHRSALVLWWCVPCLLSSPLLCLWCIALEYGFISRFKGGFRGFYGADVYLCGFGALLGLWGFCTREVFGGYMACGVFAPIFSFFHLLRLSSGALPLLSSACPLGCLDSALGLVISLCGLLFLFPLRMYAQKERAQSVFASSLVLLWVVGLLCKIWFSVLVKFVIINLDFFSYAFVRVSIFVIIPPLLEKTFKHTPDKFPCVKFIFYAFIYVI